MEVEGFGLGETVRSAAGEEELLGEDGLEPLIWSDGDAEEPLIEELLRTWRAW